MHFKKNSVSRLVAKDYRTGFLFILPMLAGFVIFVLVPIIATFALSTTNYSLLSPGEFVGLENYKTMFTTDTTFIRTTWNTLYFTVLLVPLNIVITLGLALLLSKNFKGVGLFRTVLFTPYVTSIVVWAIVWKFMFQTDNGAINLILQLFGITGPQWLYNESLAIPVVVIMTLLKGLGMNTIIFISALKNVPQMYYEAGELDGATGWKRFRRITLPLISPSIFLVAIITIIGSLKIFGQVHVMTQGGPGTSSYVFVYYIYQKAFVLFEFGYASAISTILFILIMGLTIVQWQLRKRWVHYED